ncbi:MAG: hypothetical protein JWR26_352 [Pedosphaera sp.]|nr:hypothetical protein [Pedosphaera sp.]
MEHSELKTRVNRKPRVRDRDHQEHREIANLEVGFSGMPGCQALGPCWRGKAGQGFFGESEDGFHAVWWSVTNWRGERPYCLFGGLLKSCSGVAVRG